MKRKLTTMLLAVALVLNLVPAVFATDQADISASAESGSHSAEVTDVDVIYGDGYIQEEISINVDGKIVSMVRTSYENNTAILTVSEDGNVTTTSLDIDYNALSDALDGSHIENSALTRSRVSGYTYAYMKTVTQTEYLDGTYGTYSLLLSAVSEILSSAGLPASSIASIASTVYGSTGSAVDAKFITYRHWYEVTETASGGFIGYYCEWSTFAYAKYGSGDYVYLGKESGSFDSFNVY